MLWKCHQYHHYINCHSHAMNPCPRLPGQQLSRLWDSLGHAGITCSHSPVSPDWPHFQLSDQALTWPTMCIPTPTLKMTGHRASHHPDRDGTLALPVSLKPSDVLSAPAPVPTGQELLPCKDQINPPRRSPRLFVNSASNIQSRSKLPLT